MDNDSSSEGGDDRMIIAGIPSLSLLILSIFFNAFSIYFVLTAKSLHSFFATILVYRSICEVFISSAITFFWFCSLIEIGVVHIVAIVVKLLFRQYFPNLYANVAISCISETLSTQAYMLHVTASVNRSVAIYFPMKYSQIYGNWVVRVVSLLGTTVLSITLVLLLLMDRCTLFVWVFGVTEFGTALCMYEPSLASVGVDVFWPLDLLMTAQKTLCFAAVAIDLATLLKILLLSKSAQSETNKRNIRFFLQVFTQNAFLCVSVLSGLFYPYDDEYHDYFGIYWYTGFLYNLSFFVNSITLFIFNSEVRRTISGIFKPSTKVTFAVKVTSSSSP